MMKHFGKILKILFIVPLSFLCSCDIYRTEVVKEGVDLFTDFVTARADNWTRVGTDGKPGCLAYQDFEFPEITKDVMDNGLVSVFYCSEEPVGNGLADRDHPLPYVFTVENEHSVIVTQNIRYAVERGFLRIIVEWSDSRYYLQEYDQVFKVCIMSPGK